jgi:glucose-1-phosphate adenylyltransferase
MQKVLAMVLAGGRGKRMDILCHERPKPVLPFAGRFRVIDFSLSNCIHSQINSVAILADYQRSQMSDYLRRWNLTNTAISKSDILEPRAGSYQGTADAIYQNLGYLQRCGTDSVLVLAGDHVYKMDYRKMLAFHALVKADVTVGVVRVPIEQAHRFGTVNIDSEGRILDFTEKASVPRSSLASMGIYIFNNEVLTRRLIEDAARPDSPHDFGYAVIPNMVEKDRVFAYEFDGYWQDIGTIEAYYWANMELTLEKPSFSLDGSWPIFTDNQNSSLPNISPQSSVRNSLISPGCVVKGRVENSVLSPGVCVEEHAEVRESVLMANVFVGYHSVVDHCVLDEEVNVGKSCYIGFNTGRPLSNSGITVLGKGATVPHRTAIGCNCKVLPHVGQTEFTTNMVSSGTLISPRNRGIINLPEESVAISK